MTDPRDLIQRLADTMARCEVDHRLLDEAYAYLATPEPAADGPAVPDGREPVSVAEQFSDAEMYALAEEYNGDPIPAMRRALELWGHQPPQPIPLSERLPGPEEVTDKSECWYWHPVEECWEMVPVVTGTLEEWSHWLPAHALPLPSVDS